MHRLSPTFAALVFTGVLTLGAATALAQAPGPAPQGQAPVRYNPSQGGGQYAEAPGAHTHDTLFIRLTLGFGYAGFGDDNDPSFTVSGAGTISSVSVGYTVAPNIIVYGQAGGLAIINPTAKVGDQEAELDGLTLTESGLGIGAAYYLPTNVHFSGTISAAKVFVSDDDSNTEDTTSDWGVVLSGIVGYEWWVSDNWGVGLGGQISLGSFPDETSAGEDASVGMFGVGLVGSATFN